MKKKTTLLNKKEGKERKKLGIQEGKKIKQNSRKSHEINKDPGNRIGTRPRTT